MERVNCIFCQIIAFYQKVVLVCLCFPIWLVEWFDRQLRNELNLKQKQDFFVINITCMIMKHFVMHILCMYSTDKIIILFDNTYAYRERGALRFSLFVFVVLTMLKLSHVVQKQVFHDCLYGWHRGCYTKLDLFPHVCHIPHSIIGWSVW